VQDRPNAQLVLLQQQQYNNYYYYYYYFNSIHLFIIYMPSQQLQGQLHAQNGADMQNKQTPWPLVRERTIPTEKPPLVDEI
jgi:hypothetical protein